MFHFLIQFLKNPRSIGAVAPSSRLLAEKMMEPIDFSAAKYIVEYGPGTGSFTKELIRRKKEETVLILIEQNRYFCGKLQSEYKHKKNVYIIQGSAEHVKKYLAMYKCPDVDYIISGLPFTSLPKELTKKIFINTQKVLGKKGIFITFQYSLVKRKLFERYFKLVEYKREFRNFPPAYVLVLKAKKKKNQICACLKGKENKNRKAKE